MMIMMMMMMMMMMIMMIMCIAFILLPKVLLKVLQLVASIGCCKV